MTDIALATLTEGTLTGNGIFDKLMMATKAHLEDQFLQGRIKGGDYANVYLGQLQSVMQTAMAFLTEQQKINLEAELLQKQIDLAQAQVDQTVAQSDLIKQQTANTLAELALVQANAAKAQAELALIPKQIAQIDAQIALTGQQATNLSAEALNIPKQGLQIDAQTAMITQQKANAVLEGDNLVAQKCLLQAQYDGTLQNTLSAAAQTDLYIQKNVTEKAQVLSLGVDDNSVIGRQKLLYKAQTDGFARDAEQKAAKLFFDSWNARRMTDDATVANTTNMLDDGTIGRVAAKVLTGVGA